MFQQIEEEARLERKRKKFKTAEDLKRKKCIKCGWCCNVRSCIPTPKELKKIAKFLTLTPKECINKYFAIDRENSEPIYFVKPIGINQKDLIGKFIPNDRTFNEGQCIFLDKNNLCKIHSVKPKHAKITSCWEGKEDDNFNPREAWEEGQLEKEFGIKVKEEEE